MSQSVHFCQMTTQWVCTALVSMSSISVFWIGRHTHSLHQACAQHPDLNPTNYNICAEIQQRVYPRKVHKVHGRDRHYGMAGMAVSYASSITQQMSGVNVSECAFMSNDDFLSIQFDCRLTIHHVYFDILVRLKLRVNWLYCAICDVLYFIK